MNAKELAYFIYFATLFGNKWEEGGRRGETVSDFLYNYISGVHVHLPAETKTLGPSFISLMF